MTRRRRGELADYVVVVEVRSFGQIEYRDLTVRAQNKAEAKRDVRQAGYHSIIAVRDTVSA